MSDTMKVIDPFEVRAGERVRVTETQRGVTRISEYVVDSVVTEGNGGHTWWLPDGSSHYWDPERPNGSPAHLFTVEVEERPAVFKPGTTGHAVRISRWSAWRQEDTEDEWGVWMEDGQFATLDGKHHLLSAVQGFRPDRKITVEEVHALLAQRYEVPSTQYNAETAKRLVNLLNSKGA